MLLVARDMGLDNSEEEIEDEEDLEDLHDVLSGFDVERESEELWQRILSSEHLVDLPPPPPEADQKGDAGEEVVDPKATFVIEQARDYQRQIFDRAVVRNTICMLGTGLGKTFIAVMVVKEILAQKPATKAIVLCPTAFLVEQQCDVFRSNAPYDVSMYHGGLSGIDDWTPDRWQREWSERRVFVMTPQVLVNALNHAHVTLDSVSVVVLDECHHVASGDHPMRQLMERVCEMRPLPRVMGLTASPLMCVPKDLTAGIALLESLMAGSQLITAHVGDAYKPPVEEVFYFDNCRMLNLKEPLLRMFPGRKKDSLDAYHRQKVLKTVSLWLNLCGRAARRYLLAQSDAKWGGSLMTMVGDCLRRLGATGFEQFVRPGTDEEVPNDYLCPKLVKLLEIIKTRRVGVREQLLVFVEQRDMAYQMSIEIAKRTGLTADWLIGISSPLDVNNSTKAMMRRFRRFKAGEIEVLVATAAAEEGIDVPGVSAVISYDGVKQVKSYVQMRGRCRFSMSRYIIFNQNENQQVRYEQAARVESDLFEWISNRPSSLRIDEAFLESLEEQILPEDGYREQYVVPSTGASCDQRSCVSLLFRFAQSFCGEEGVIVQFEQRDKLFVGILRLSNFLPKALRMYISSAHTSRRDCKRHLCMLAIKRLHASKWLTDHLLPVSTVSLMGKDSLSPDDPEHDALMMEILLAQLEARRKRVEEKSGGTLLIGGEEDERLTKKKAEVAEAKTVRSAMQLVKQEDILCKLWSEERRFVLVVQFGRFGKLKMALPIELPVGESMTIDHPMLGFINVKVLEAYPAPEGDPFCGFSEDERLFSDNLWRFLDPAGFYEPQHRFLMCCGDPTQFALMLNRFREIIKEDNDPALMRASVAETYEFLWMSKTQKKTRLYAGFNWSPDKTAKSAFSDPKKAPTFEAYFAVKYGFLPPTPADANRPLALLKIIKTNFRARHFPINKKKSTYREELPFYAARYFWLLRDFYFTLECLPTFIRRARRSYAARRAARMFFSEAELAEKPSILEWYCEAVTPGCAGLDGATLERLEFLGDSVLKMMVTRRLFEEFPYDEGRLTDLRGVVIANSRLAQLFVQGPMCGAVDPRGVSDWCRMEASVRLSLKGAADAMEALLGALYFASDCNMERVVEASSKMGLFHRFPTPVRQRLPLVYDNDDDDNKIPAELGELQQKIGYRFKSPLLLLEAMTHTSHARSIVANYNRLELLGDAVVDLTIVVHAMASDKTLTPGRLSDWRYICGSTEALARVSKQLGLNRYVQHFSSRLTRELDAYCSAPPAVSVWLDLAPKMMADVFESLVGAVLVDTRYDYRHTLDLCLRLASPVWNACTPNPDFEPTREIRELLVHAPDLRWVKGSQSIVANNVELAKMHKPVPHWQRLVAWKACRMIHARPEIVDALVGLGKVRRTAEPKLLLMPPEPKADLPPNPVLLELLNKMYV